jgi:hypothetical protein
MSGPDAGPESREDGGQVLRPRRWHPRDRNILLGVSHPSNDPARHRTFEIRASFDAETGRWLARVGEQNLNEQRGAWGADLTPAQQEPGFLTAAECLGDAVTRLIARVDREAHDAP